jgi:hypothetical protein
LEAIVRDRNAPQKHVWRAEIVLLTAEELGTVEIMRRKGPSLLQCFPLEASVRPGDGLTREFFRSSCYYSKALKSALGIAGRSSRRWSLTKIA